MVEQQEIKKMYRTSKWDDKIEVIGVISETEKTVTIKNTYNGRLDRENKVGSYKIWHQTREDAVNHLLGRYKLEIESAHKVISDNQKLMDELIDREGLIK